MDLKFAATVELKPADVQRIVEEAVKAQMQGYNVSGVKFEASLDYGPMDRGHGTPVFTGMKVTLVPKPEAKERYERGF